MKIATFLLVQSVIAILILLIPPVVPCSFLFPIGIIYSALLVLLFDLDKRKG